jgi:hypothetical protein
MIIFTHCHSETWTWRHFGIFTIPTRRRGGTLRISAGAVSASITRYQDLTDRKLGVTLEADEVQILHQSSLLHQEFHALAFCSETIQQIDFTNCTASVSSRTDTNREAAPFLQFLTPILNLLRSDITKCSHLILSRNSLRIDLEDIGTVALFLS